MPLGITSKFEITVRFFDKNDEKNDLETLYDFTTNLLEENELCARVRGTLRDYSFYYLGIRQRKYSCCCQILP